MAGWSSESESCDVDGRHVDTGEMDCRDAGRGKRIAMAASTREKQQESAFTLSRHHEARLMVESSRGISRDGWQQEKSKTAVEPESGRKV